ncbi:uncharacterized protein BDZ99DRAFT_487227 [Mytilinidion resinicola]|uniref:CRIB domain-containing protein n=1 Tax=Mytilinidion resinicola TaxID=574789 RepID=A0A6A6YRL2_9PEZI|nr:uncharacterized protein BDZ99DRAFT_487227 [Mytilinidion resinicola]KAF2811440.1 hypothetical protein BDZ99DRAFT_487227 [Mytilinidion resinicola]
MGSPERRERGFGKRNSVFTLRSRSNTASTTSSFVSRTSTITSMTGIDMSSRRSSQDLSGSQPNQQLPAQKRSLFSRGKKLRRQSSQVSTLSGLDGIEEADSYKRASVLRKDHNLSRWGSHSPIYDLKEHISSPFDFQHLTHTQRQQFPALERVPQNELVAEYWAVRASQVPRRELHGIKADDLHFQNFSSEAVDSTGPTMRSHSSFAKSPPLSPQTSREYFTQGTPSPVLGARPSLRHSRSVESFSQPVVKARHRLSQSVNPPPRSSSRMALERIDDSQEQSAETGYAASLRGRYSRVSAAFDRSTPPSRPSTAGSLSTVTAEATFIAQAVTTPDDTAIPALSPGFTSDLENVPEEPERFFNPRPAPQPPLKSPSFEGYKLPQWSPTSRSTSRTSSYGTPKSFSQRSPKARPTSQMSDTLGSPIQLRSGKSSNRQSPAAKRQSVYWKNIDESWEDDIDYCYEHAAEADCDYDWDRNSIECDEEKDRPVSPRTQPNDVSQSPTHSPITEEEDDDEVMQTRFFPGVFRPSLLVPSATSLPELDHRSALSTSTVDTGALTPSDVFSSAPVHEARVTSYMESEGFSLTPSLLVPQDFKYQSMREEMYEDLLAEYEHSDHHYPILDTAQSVSGSSRSSRTRLSKRSSYDSSLLSGQGSISSPVRRSASSSGSLPELVHSRRGRKILDLMVDQLSEQAHTFAHLDEDDEDDGVDRPSTATERTFFADDDDHTPTQDEDSQKLEPVSAPATAPTPSAPAHHERAASDGAAKLLSSASRAPITSTKTRARAASAATAYKPKQQTYTLSLFPAPPKARKANS